MEEAQDFRHVYAYEPEGFDVNSCLVACNFPPGTTESQAWSFFAWMAPVVRVEKLQETLHGEANFTVVFADSGCCERLMHTPLLYDGLARKIHVHLCEKRPSGISTTLWSWFGYAKATAASADEALGVSSKLSVLDQATGASATIGAVAAGATAGLALGVAAAGPGLGAGLSAVQAAGAGGLARLSTSVSTLTGR